MRADNIQRNIEFWNVLVALSVFRPLFGASWKEKRYVLLAEHPSFVQIQTGKAETERKKKRNKKFIMMMGNIKAKCVWCLNFNTIWESSLWVEEKQQQHLKLKSAKEKADLSEVKKGRNFHLFFSFYFLFVSHRQRQRRRFVSHSLSYSHCVVLLYAWWCCWKIHKKDINWQTKRNDTQFSEF